jgi:hypothetical protein
MVEDVFDDRHLGDEDDDTHLATAFGADRSERRSHG